MGYKLARFLVKALVFLLFRVELVNGLGNIPRTGSLVAVSNHLGRLDPALLYAYIDRRDMIVMAAEKYKSNPIFRWMVKEFNAIWVDRFNADFAAMRAALQRLKQGEAMVLAPEGTRSPTGALIKARSGASYLAYKAGVPIIPVAIAGSEDRRVKSELLRLRRPKVRVWVGLPFTLPQIKGREREEILEMHTDEMMCHIAALLPPEYRGVYADHPRLRELEAEGYFEASMAAQGVKLKTPQFAS